MGWTTLRADAFARTETPGPPAGYTGAAAWTVDGDRLTLTNTTAVAQLLAALAFTGTEQRVSARQFGGVNGGLMLRRVDASNYYGIRRTSAGTAQPFVVLGGTLTLLGTATALAVGARMGLAATEEAGGAATILTPWFDGTAGAPVRLTAPAQRLYGRGWGLRAQTAASATVQYDDLLVEEFVADAVTWYDGVQELPAEHLGWWDGATLTASTFEGNAP